MINNLGNMTTSERKEIIDAFLSVGEKIHKRHHNKADYEQCSSVYYELQDLCNSASVVETGDEISIEMDSV